MPMRVRVRVNEAKIKKISKLWKSEWVTFTLSIYRNK